MSVGKGGRVVGSACVEKFLAALSYSLTGMGRGREKTIKYSNYLASFGHLFGRKET